MKITIWNSTGLRRGGYEYIQLSMSDFILALDPYLVLEQLRGWWSDDADEFDQQIHGQYHQELWNAMLLMHNSTDKHKWRPDARIQLRKHAYFTTSAHELLLQARVLIIDQCMKQKAGYTADDYYIMHDSVRISLREALAHYGEVFDRYVKFVRYVNSKVK